MGDGFRVFTTGEIVTAAQANGYWMEQVVAKFADATARDAAITAPEEGMHAWVAANKALYRYQGGAWVFIEGWGTGSPEGAVSAGVGAVWHRTDGGSGTSIYVKESGSGSTGWVAHGGVTVKDADETYTRRALRLVAGTGIGVELVDDSVGDEVEATITVTAVSTDMAVIHGFLGRLDDIGGTGGPTQFNRIRSSGSAGSGVAQVPVVMDRSGSIVGLALHCTSARNAGTLTVEVYKNGSATGFTAVIDGTNTQWVTSTQVAGTDTFVAGDRLDVRGTTSGFSMSGATGFEAAITVQF